MSTAEAQISVNTNLQKQDLSNLDVKNLTPLSPEVISRQATINIGTIGHVAHGKSTVVKAISGVQTVRFKNELERNITIKLERISHQRMQELLASPTLLREFEARQQAKMWHRRQFRDSPSRTSDETPSTLYERDHSLSPSSGYESLNDNASNYSGEYTSRTLIVRLAKTTLCGSKLPPKPTVVSTKRASCQSPAPSTRKRRKQGEYVVERIESIESVGAKPVFYIKWLNYPKEQNTWESLENLSECVLLEPFIEKNLERLEGAIASITRDIDAEIKRKALRYDPTKLVMQDLDSYDPLTLKIDLILLAQFQQAGSRNVREPEKIRQRVIEAMLLKPYYYKRKQQLVALQQWKERMNRVEHAAPINVENNIDLEVLDPKFEYILNNFAGAGVEIVKGPPIGCKCVNGCTPSSRCCARLADSYFAYQKNGRLRIRPGEAIYECNTSCTCSDDCTNRVIQRGRNNSLCLFKTANGCGWGVRTERAMRKGEYVSEYVGEIITVEEANERGKQYDAVGRTYLFDLDYNTAAENMYTIDAASYGNISHFFNHSCDPNLAVFPFWIDNLDINMPRLAFFTLRPITAGEELTFDYIRTEPGEDDYQNLSEAEKVTCRCGAANCRKVLF